MTVHERGVFTPQAAQEVWEAVQWLRKSGIYNRHGGPRLYNAPPNTPVYVRNDSGEQVPRYACMQAIGTVEVGNADKRAKQNIIKIDKPQDDTGEAGPYLFNLHTAIPEGEYGIATAGPEVRVLSDVEASSGTPLGPVEGSWSVDDNGGLLIAIGPDDIDEDVMRCLTSNCGGETIQVVHDVLLMDDKIRFLMKNIRVCWHEDTEPYDIPLTDCEDLYGDY